MSKFSTLPDIDLTSVDVYETASSPDLKTTKGGSRGSAGRALGGDSDLTSDEDEGEIGGERGSPAQRRRRKEQKAEEQDGRASIDRRGIKSEEARDRFEGSTQVRKAGSSASARTRKKHGAGAPSYLDTDIYELELSSNRALETPLGRLRRLRLEAEELEQQLSNQVVDESSASAQEKQKGKAAVQGRQPTPEDLLAHVRALRVGLNELQVERIEGTAVQDSSVAQAKTVLESLTNGQILSQGEKEAAGLVNTPDSGHAGADIATARQANKTNQLADVEERLAMLEALVGSTQSILEETQSLPRPLLPSLSRLEHLSTLLTQPRHIDAISKRIKVLVSELDRVYESRRRLAALSTSSVGNTLHDGKATSYPTINKPQGVGSGEEDISNAPLDPITLSRLDDVFALSSRIQPLLPLAPSLLARLRSLSTLHVSASEFSSSLDTLKASQSEVKSGQEEVKKAMSSLEDSMKSNEGRVKGNLEVVMKRLEELDERVKRL